MTNQPAILTTSQKMTIKGIGHQLASHANEIILCVNRAMPESKRIAALRVELERIAEIGEIAAQLLIEAEAEQVIRNLVAE